MDVRVAKVSDKDGFSIQVTTFMKEVFPLICHRGRRPRWVVAGIVERVPASRSTRAMVPGESHQER